MADVLAFWAAALVVAAFGYPIGAVLLRRLPDGGAGVALPLGLVLASYGYFILRVLDLLPPGRGGYLGAIALLGLAGAAAMGRDRWSVVTLRRGIPGLGIAFGIFTVAFFGYVAFRSYNAEIGGTEQPMDLMYLNATLNAEEFPPKDPWLAGEKASYYYFGYLQSGVLTAVSGVPASTGYNLSLAYTFAASAAAIGSLGFALARWMLGARGRAWATAAGAHAIVVLLFVGSLAAVFEWTAAHGHIDRGIYAFFGAEEIAACSVPKVTDYCYSGVADQRTTAWYPTEFWFWFRDTRIIPDTITESPFFSFLLGDLHPHVTSIPVVLLVLALSLATWRGRSVLDFRVHRRLPIHGLAVAILLGALAFQNAWDVLTFTLVFSLAVFARNLRRAPPLTALVTSVGYVAPLGGAAILLYLPWVLTFSSQAEGIQPYVGAGTRPAHVLLQFGPIVAAGIVASASATRGLRRAGALNAALGAAWLPVLPFISWVAFAWLKGDLTTAVESRTAGGWWTLVIYAFALWAVSLAAVLMLSARRAGAAPAAFAALGILLLYGSELFYVKDVFAGGAPRLNTIFKLSYQAWMLLALGGGAATVAVVAEARRRPVVLALAGPALVLVWLGLAFPLLASFNRTEAFTQDTHIDGLAAVRASDPGEYALVEWIAENTPRDAVVIEATGRRWSPGADGPAVVDGGSDYSDAGRISARTGRSTPIGWYFHEIQWRGNNADNHAEYQRRQQLVDSVYISGDPDTVLDVMQEFGAEYLVVGRIELSRYPGLLPDFSTFLDVAYRTANYTIYRLPQHTVVQTS
jgi:YYY domain-containing protein